MKKIILFFWMSFLTVYAQNQSLINIQNSDFQNVEAYNSTKSSIDKENTQTNTKNINTNSFMPSLLYFLLHNTWIIIYQHTKVNKFFTQKNRSSILKTSVFFIFITSRM